MKKFLSCFIALIFVLSCDNSLTLAASQYSSDYRLWSQGASGYPRVKNYGCFIVAMAKMIVESGVDTSPTFNPDVFAKWEEDTGHISSLTNSIRQNDKLGPEEYANQKGKILKYEGPNTYSDETLWNYINNGYYCIVYISYGSGSSHYVFVSNSDSKANSELMFYESGKSSTQIGVMNKSKLLSRYSGSSMKTLYVYKGNSCNHKYDANTETCINCGEKFNRSYTNINKTYQVINNNSSLRSKPYSKCGEIYTRIKAGTKVTVKRSFKNVYDNEWYEVSYGNYNGYMYGGNLDEYVEKKASTLSIDLTDYPKSIKVGSGYGLRGTIKSNYEIKKVSGYIKKDNTTVQSSTDTPNKTSMDIKSANLNNKLVFSKLSAGNYHLYIEAVDSSGNKKQITQDFNVYEEKAKEDSTLSINLEKYPVTLSLGSSYGLRGSVTSNYNISEVRGYVINSSGSVVLSSKDTPNEMTMDIRYADLNNSLIFNKLSAGSYIMKVVAYDISGRQVTATKDFTVQGNTNENTNADSTLNINMTSYPSSINQGSNYGLRGSVSSNYNITKVNGYVINSSGNTVMSSDDTPNAKSMDVRYANLNDNLVFGKLGAGSYTLKVVAVDSSGKTKEWSSGFSVNGNQETQSNTRIGIVNIPSSWNNLSIRSGPGTSYQIVGSMNQGERCTVYPDKTQNGWYYVSYNGVTGYASGKQINLQ